VVNRDLRMLWRNDAAEGLLEQNDGLSIRTGVIALADQYADKALRRAVFGAMDGTGPLHIRQLRRAGRVALVIEVFSAVGMSHLPGCSDAMATIIITDPMGAIELQDSQSLSAEFDLTPAEARVARLLPLSLNRREIAERLGLSENTVKTHLSSTREKLGAHSMTELALIVARFRGALTSDA
jgi:DNA-binding CsgD family transcriptional regulator